MTFNCLDVKFYHRGHYVLNNVLVLFCWVCVLTSQEIGVNCILDFLKCIVLHIFILDEGVDE